MQENKEFLRGHRAKTEIIDWCDCKLSKEEIDEVIKPFVSKEKINVKLEIYVTSSTQSNNTLMEEI